MKKQEKLKLEEIKKAADVLKNGGVVVFPTDTVFGIGCAISQKEAIERIYKIKGTESEQQFPILISNLDQAGKIADLNNSAKELAKKYWPGALTLVVKSKLNGKTIGLRIPASQITRKLIELTGEPIIGTSANFHSKPSVSREVDLDRNLLKLVDFKLSGSCGLKTESTVADVTTDKIKILRQGAINFRGLKGLGIIP